MAVQIPKELRMLEFDKLYLANLPHAQIADQLGVSIPTVKRYAAIRRARMLATIPAKQALVFDMVLQESLKDHQALQQLIDLEEKASLVVTDAYGKKIQIRRDLLKLVGVEQPIRDLHKHEHKHIHVGEKTEVSLNGPVQIIVEENGGGFDPNHGAGQIRVDSPSADEISSASS
jgi:predicted transcriptional regulator